MKLFIIHLQTKEFQLQNKIEIFWRVLMKEINKNTEMTIEDKVIEWKKEYKKVFLSTIDDEDYIWRRIKRKEYSDIMAIKDTEDVDERIYQRQIAIAKLVVLNFTEEELEERIEELAGLASTIADEVLSKSGFNLTSTTEL